MFRECLNLYWSAYGISTRNIVIHRFRRVVGHSNGGVYYSLVSSVETIIDFWKGIAEKLQTDCRALRSMLLSSKAQSSESDSTLLTSKCHTTRVHTSETDIPPLILLFSLYSGFPMCALSLFLLITKQSVVSLDLNH